jgi:hypothetical protein
MARRPKIDPRTPKTIHVRVGNPVRINKGDRASGYVPKYTEFPFIRIDNQVRINLDYTSLKTLVETFTDLFNQYGETYSDLRIDAVRGECGCYYSDCGCGPEYYLVGSRLETEDEIDVRIELDTKRQAAADNRERKEFERLQKKFGDKYEITKKG